MSSERRSGLRRWWIVVAAQLLCGAVAASACAIPVFRFALERWEADRFQVIVYHREPLSVADAAVVDELQSQSVVSGGPLNIEVIVYDLAAPEPPKLLDAVPPAAEVSWPWVEVRGRVDHARWMRRWQGPLADAKAGGGLYDSPARREIIQRILAGHSGVWLVVGPDETGTLAVEKKLQAALADAARQLPLPQGIGSPGSELYAPVPLELRFSVLSVVHGDPAERQFLQLLAATTPAWRADGTYVIPVFGRCRALEVIPWQEAEDEATIADIAAFICGACSCQVKQANPGFDLLVAADWEQRLFGATIPDLPATADVETADGAPQYVPIPTPRKSPEVRVSQWQYSTVVEVDYTPLVVAAMVSGVFLAAVVTFLVRYAYGGT
ncbi:MAG: hypothetical protein AB7F89_13130 [Pirellulaceae bacterium]